MQMYKTNQMDKVKFELKTIANQDGFWPILALDHGLTAGYKDAVEPSQLIKLLNSCGENFSAIVLNYGMAREIRSQLCKPLILQCFGAPMGSPKVCISDINTALKLKAKAISVQIDFGLESRELAMQIQAASEITRAAHCNGLPVLFMITPQKQPSVDGLLRSVRYCHELGADLIKLRCNTTDLTSTEISQIRHVLNSAPPTLLAGGEKQNNLVHELTAARSCSFSGYCIGRNIFQSDNPQQTSVNLFELWQSLKE